MWLPWGLYEVSYSYNSLFSADNNSSLNAYKSSVFYTPLFRILCSWYHKLYPFILCIHWHIGILAIDNGHFCLLSLHWALAGGSLQWVFAWLLTASQFTVVLWDSWTQAPLAFRARWLVGDLFPRCDSLKSWDAIFVVQTFQSSGRIWELGVPSWLYGAVLGVGIVVWDYVSVSPTHFNVAVLLVSQCVGVTQLVSESLSERTVSCATTYSACQWEERNSEVSCVVTLVQSLHAFQAAIKCIWLKTGTCSILVIDKQEHCDKCPLYQTVCQKQVVFPSFYSLFQDWQLWGSQWETCQIPKIWQQKPLNQSPLC